MTRARATIPIAIIAALAAGWITFSRLTSSDDREASDLAAKREAIRQANAQVPLTLAPADTAIRAILSGVCERASIGSSVSPEVARSLAFAASDFLAHRFAGDSVAYARWSHAQGYSLLSPNELEESWHLRDAFRMYGVDPPEGTASSEELWDLMWAAAQRAPARSLTLRSLPDTSDGFSVVIGTITRAKPNWPEARDPVYQSIPYSGAVTSSRPWWHHPRGWTEQLESEGRAVVAQVAFLTETASDDRGTVCLRYVLDPTTRSWLLQAVYGDIQKRLEY